MEKIIPSTIKKYNYISFVLSALIFLVSSTSLYGQENPKIFNAPVTSKYTIPVGVTTIKVEVWGAGGGGGTAGGGGGAYASKLIDVIPGDTFYVTVGNKGTATNDGGYSSFSDKVVAGGGKGALSYNQPGAGGFVITGVGFAGGIGGNGSGKSGKFAGGGGGGSAFTNAIGNNGASTINDSIGGVGGAGTGYGGNGGSSIVDSILPTPGNQPGGGGGGRSSAKIGSAAGANGRVVISWVPCPDVTTVVSDGNSCGSTVLSASGGAGGIIYFQGKNSNGTSTSFPSTSQTVTSSGTYYFRSKSSGCWGPQGSIVIALDPVPVGNLIVTENSGITPNDNIICSGSNVKFAAPAGYNYYIFVANLTDTLQKGPDSLLYSNTIVDGEMIRVNVLNGSNCATTFGPVTITVNPLPTPTLIVDKSSICPGENVQFIASGGNNYTFLKNGSQIQTGTSNIYIATNVTSDISVTVVVKNTNNCSATSAAVPVTVKPLPAGTLSAAENSGSTNDNKVCAGASVTFTATAGAGYIYDFKIGGVSVQTPSTVNTFTTPFPTSGNFTVTVEVQNGPGGCKAIFGPTQVITVIAPPSGSLVASENSGTPNNNTICIGATVTFTATSGTGNNYKFYLKGVGAALYDGPLNTYSTSTLVNGDYLTVLVTNSNSCFSTYTSSTITVVDAIVGTLTSPSNPTTTICAGGEIEFFATDGFANYNFKVGSVSFQNGPTHTASHTGFADGDLVTVEVTNSSSCTSVFGPLTIHVNPLPTGTLTIAETSGNKNNDGTICTGANVVFNASASFANYNFKINGVTAKYGTSNTYNTDTLKNGDVVSVEVTSSFNCIATFDDVITITVNPLPPVEPITIAASAPPEVCVGNTIDLDDITTGGTWLTSDASLATVNASGIVTGINAGNVTISYRVTNANGCDSTVTKVITVRALPTVDAISGPSKACVNDIILFSNPTIGGTWGTSDPAIATVDGSGLVTFIASGPVNITYTILDNVTNCSKTVVHPVTVNSLPVVDPIAGLKKVCINSTINLTDATPGGVWSSSDITLATVNSSGVVTGKAFGNPIISYKVTNGSGCSTIATYSITVNALPPITLDGPNPICLGSTNKKYTTESGQFNYVWTVTNGTITAGGTSTDNTIAISWLTAGAKGISVNYQDANGCSANTSATVLNAPGSSPGLTGPTAVCQNSTGNVYSTEPGKNFYAWTINGGTITAGDSTESVIVTWNDAGAKSITVNYANPGGCSAASPTIRNVTVNPQPTIVINTPAAVCSPAIVNLTLPAITAGSTGDLTYTYWTDVLATISYATPATAGAGTYYIKGTTTPAGCSDIKAVTVTINPKPTVIITNPAAVCSPATANLTNLAVTSGSTTGLTYTYWTNATATTVYATPTTAGAGTYYIKGTTPEGCFDIEPVIVTVNPKPSVVTHNPAAVCSPGTVDLTAQTVTTGSTAGLTFTYWTDASATIPYATPTTATAGTYYIKGTTAADCYDIQPVAVTVNPKPTVVTHNPEALCSPATADLTLSAVTSGSTAGLTYTYWTDAFATDSYSTPTMASAGTYYIKGTTGPGCFDIQPVTVTVNQTPSIVITNPAAVCAPATVNITLPTVTSGSTPGLTYTYWTDIAATISYATPTTAGAGTYYIKGTTGTGCIDIKPVVVTVNPLPTATISSSSGSACEGDLVLPVVTFTGANGTSPYTFTYTINGGGNLTALSTGNMATVNVPTGAPGALTYKLISVSDNSTTLCSSTIMGQSTVITVNAVPAPFFIYPASSAICQADIVPLSASKNISMRDSVTFSNKTAYPIPNPVAVGQQGVVTSSITVTSIPADAVIDSVSVKFNVHHGQIKELIFNLKAPNGNVLNLINQKGGNHDNFINTIISSAATSPLYGGAPYTGTFLPDAVNNVGYPDASNVVNFNSLYSVPNGIWTFEAADVNYGSSPISGTLNDWLITIHYTVPILPLKVTWTPATDLYTDPAATIAYTGIAASTVYAKPSVSRQYIASATNSEGCSTSQTVSISVGIRPVVTISADYCIGNGKVRLTATATPTAISYLWSTGETTSYIDVDIADNYNVTVFSGTGYCAGRVSIDVARELVFNGDFEKGNVGFTSAYPYKTAPGSLSGPPGYAVDTAGHKYAWFMWGKDHTTTHGKFMMINGATGVNYQIWQQTINVYPNTTYYFSAWGLEIDSLGPNKLEPKGQLPANAILQFNVGGGQVGTLGNLPRRVPTPKTDEENDEWVRFYGTWTSGPNTTSVLVSITDLQGAVYGNNFGLDDISFATLSPFIVLISNELTDAQIVCVNETIENIVYRVGNSTPEGPDVAGLPDGVTTSFVGDKLTISGTPTVPGNYTYTITTTICAPYSVTGTITVQAQTLTLSSETSSPTICINAPIPTIEFTIGGTATSAALISGTMPPGVSAPVFSGGKITISGTPTVAGVYPYKIATTGTCRADTVSGVITVLEQEITLTSSGPTIQNVCIGEDISAIIYTVGGSGSGAGVTGLPPGVSGYYSNGIFIISGKPDNTASGTYLYTVTTTGTCSDGAKLGGSITINPDATITLSSGGSQPVCINNAMTTPIKYTIGGGGADATVSGLPDGVNGTYNMGTGIFTITGTPSVAGTFIYTVATTGTCAQKSISATLIVTEETIYLTSGNKSPTFCPGSTWTDIVFTIGGAATSAVFNGILPAGLKITNTGNVYTITVSGSPFQLGSFPYTFTTNGNCDQAVMGGTININTGSISGDLPALISVCAGKTGTINLIGKTGDVIRWESSTNGGPWETAVNTNTTTTYQYINLVVPTQYRAVVKNGACNAVTSSPVKVAVHNYWTGGTDSDWNIAANWSDNLVADIGCATTYIPPSPNQPLLSSGTATINDLIIYGGATLTVNGGIMQIAGTVTKDPNGVFDATNGTMEFNGNTAQIVSGATYKNRTIKNLVVSNTNTTQGLSLTSTTGDTLNLTGTLSFGSSITNADFKTRGNLTLKSTAAGTARVDSIPGNNKITDSVIVERYLPVLRKAWHLLAPNTRGNTIQAAWQEGAQTLVSTSVKNPNPGFGTNINGEMGDWNLKGFDQPQATLPAMKYYNYGTNSYLGVASTSLAGSWNNKLGYFIFIRGDRSVISPSQATTSTILRSKGILFQPNLIDAAPRPLTGLAADQWIIVGNPYASAINFFKLGLAGLQGSYDIWDPNGNTSQFSTGIFRTITSDDTKLIAVPAGGIYSGNNIPNIQSGEAFMVQAATGATGSIQFTESAKVSESSNAPFFTKPGEASNSYARPGVASSAKLWATLYSNKGSRQLADGVLTMYSDDYSNDYGMWDAAKMPNLSENMGIAGNDRILAIERRQMPTVNDTIQYNMDNWKIQNYQFAFTTEDMGSTGVQPYLNDRYLGKQTLISLNDTTWVDFSIVNVPGSWALNRFYVTFKPTSLLPVTLLSVTATPKNPNVEVGWKTENEINVKEYEVEKSSDARLFKKITTVPSTRKGGDIYKWLDENAVMGWNYYRIRTIDNDGKFTLSSVVKAYVQTKPGLITVAPNPVIDGKINLYLKNEVPGTYWVRLLNALGQPMLSKKISHDGGTNSYIINSDFKIAKEIYQLEVTKPDGSIQVIKIVF